MTGADRGPVRRAAAASLAALVAGGALLDAWYGGGWFVGGPGLVPGALLGGYLLGAWLPSAPAAAAVAASAVALTLASQHHEPGAYPFADDVAFFLLMVGGPAIAGAGLDRRRRQVRELELLRQRLAAQRTTDLEAARLEERQRVEVSVHRRLIEQIGGIVLLAEGARHHGRPATVATALGDIEEAARGALGELREAVGTLRTSPEAAAAAVEPATPSPSEPPPGPRDVAVAAALGGAIAVETLVRDFTRGPAWANVLAALAVAAPLVWRRTRPLAAMATAWLLATASTLLLTPLTLTVTALGLVLVATYAVGAHARAWPAGLGLSWAGTLALALATPPAQRDPAGLAPALALSALVLLAGRLAAGAARRAATLASLVAALERGREAELSATVARTRLDLARSLHDSVAQAMTAACLQAATARGIETEPDPALDTILAVARECVAELRAGLDELDGQTAPLDPASVQRLADRLGLVVEWRHDAALEQSGAVGPLVHRVVREALTNAARHAPGARVRVSVVDAPGAVEVEIVDEGAEQPAAALGTGTGLTGLAEALQRSGGTLSVGPRPGGGFRVAASVPRDGAVVA